MDLKPDPFAPAQQFESAYFARKLFPLVERLALEFEEEWRLQVKDVGLLFRQLAVFFEKSFGRNSTERQFPKLPAQLLRDTSLNGSVHFLLKTYHNYLKTHSLTRLDFDNAEQHQQSIDFLLHLRDALLKSGWLKFPVVHVDALTGSSKDDLEAIVRSLGGKISDTADDPSVTHIVYPFGPEGDPDDGLQYLRSLEMRPGEFFVHYWYFPDSYDNWMPADVAPENLEPDHKPIGPWKVYLRWLIDSQKFNEWMNPIDYETEEFQDEQEALQDQAEETKTLEEEEDEEESNGLNSDEDVDSVLTDEKTLHKRKRDALTEFLSQTTAAQDFISGSEQGRKLRSESHRPEIDESEATKIAPNVIRHKAVDVSKEAFSGAVENISQCLEGGIVDEAEEMDLDDDSEFYRQLYTIPAHASWFDWNEIHQVEKEGVPVKTDADSEGVDPEVYKHFRNRMVDKFREKPHRRLTFSDVRRKLPGDVEDIKMTYDFLTKWGLINFFPASVSQTNRRRKRDSDEGMSVSLPSAAPPLIHFSNSVTLPEIDAAVTHGNELAFSLLSQGNKYGKTITDASSQPGGIRCSAMPWIDCTESYYHCTTRPNIDLCHQAYSEGRFPAGTSSKDYIKIDSSQPATTDGTGWSEQETLLLLEAIEMYRDDWAEIAEHVATKSQLQCAMHWLTMSIEEDFVDELLAKEQTPFQGSDEDFMKALPFADARNPVMAQIAFLAAMVSPDVAGAAAQEALLHLSQENSAVENPQESGHGPSTSQPAQSTGMSTDSMRKAAVAALKSATVRAKLLAEQEEREIQKLMNTVINSQIKKIEIKLSYCAEQDKALDDERGQLAAARKRVNADRLRLRSQLIKSEPQTGESLMMDGPTDNGVKDEVGRNGQ